MKAAHIVLVHGTWGRGWWRLVGKTSSALPEHRYWFQLGSSFYEAIRTSVPAQLDFHAFLWSGANRFIGRYGAAIRLAKELLRLSFHDPSTPVLVIAHSHGGNVALLAASLLSAKHRPLAIATMGTPFIYVTEKEISGFESSAMLLGVVLTIVITPFILGVLVPLIIIGWAEHSESYLLLSLAIIAAIAIFYFVFSSWDGIVNRVGKRYRKLKYRLLKSSPKNLPCDLLVLRATGDEASGALAASSLMARLLSLLKRRTIGSNPVIATLRVIVLIFLLSWGVFALAAAFGSALCWGVGVLEITQVGTFCETVRADLHRFGTESGWVLLLFVYGWFLIPVIFFMFFITEAIIVGTFFGADAISAIYSLQITSEARPIRGNSTHNIREPDVIKVGDSERLAHGLYNLKQSRETLTRWIMDYARIPNK